ncbi:MAG: hypothetical protein WCP08_04430 [Prolixibacteraceae bacterium]
MKKAFSILFALLILLSGMHMTIASHICCGELAAVKYSFTGEKATCGMEDFENEASANGEVKTDCCKNHISSFSTDNNYFPSFSVSKVLTGDTVPVLAVLPEFFVTSPMLKATYYSMVGPPVLYPHSEVDQSFICVFII